MQFKCNVIITTYEMINSDDELKGTEKKNIRASIRKT